MAFARSYTEPRPLSDLNTTPLIDVMLVLLIMFIVTMPMATHKVAIDMPGHSDIITPDSTRNRVSIDAAGAIRWNDHIVNRAQLRALLDASLRLPVEPALDLRPAAEARYELVDSVIADIKRAGVTKLGLPGNEAYGAF